MEYKPYALNKELNTLYAEVSITLKVFHKTGKRWFLSLTLTLLYFPFRTNSTRGQGHQIRRKVKNF
jgi:hypothetical protein